MSLPSPNRNSIMGWVKNFKKLTLSQEDVSDIHPTPPILIPDSNSHNNFIDSSFNMSPTQRSPNVSSPHAVSPHHTSFPFSSLPKAQEFLRPLLHHKSRSTNNVARIRSDSETSSSLRQNRDSFMQINPLVDENSKYFGVPLSDAIDIAHAKISILNNDLNSNQVLQYGKIPIVVAKCGVYLKKKGLNVEGIFRVGGSSKRLKDLQLIFNNPPDFGKKLNWDGYNVHDAALILRRYLNALPEPLIPLDLYETFRKPLQNRERIISYMKFKAENPKKSLKEFDLDLESISNSNSNANSQTDLSSEDNLSTQRRHKKNYKKLTRDVHESIQEYKILVDKLPLLSKQLLFYILDLLAMVQNHASDNLMSSRNLSAIFQPSILSHPNHDLDPIEYALSQVVVEFLIQYAYKLLPNQTELKNNVSSKNLTQLNQKAALTLDAQNKTNKNTNDTSAVADDFSPEVNGLLILPGSSTFRRQHSKSVSSNRGEDYVSSNIDQVEKPYIDSADMEHNVSDGSSDEDLIPKFGDNVSPPEILVENEGIISQPIPRVSVSSTIKSDG